MGQEIAHSQFSQQDFDRFDEALQRETARLADWFRSGRLSERQGVAGFELEAWLIDGRGDPAPINEQYLQLLDDGGLYSPELSRFNIELNSTPRQLQGAMFGAMHDELRENWRHCRSVAQRLDADLLMIGILPTVTDEMLTLKHMSAMQRYRALNEQVLVLRQGKPLQLDIQGEDHLLSEHADLMLEAATTSFQIHLQVAPHHAVAYYNAMQILSAPMVAITANSPMLFGKRLWQETRIPLFEQAVAVGGFDGAAFGPVKRVSFGSGYARDSLMEVFEENRDHFPLLLPVHLGEEPDELAHLRLHNGTIWRWNRPLVGHDEDGRPHLRIEHRVIPAGPTVIDTIANLAFFLGLVHALVAEEPNLEQRLAFAAARDNFYKAARYGLNATVDWLDGGHGRMQDLLEGLLPLSRRGLLQMGCDSEDFEPYLQIIAERLLNRQHGAHWQLAYMDQHQQDLYALVQRYHQLQESGLPVHRWPLTSG